MMVAAHVDRIAEQQRRDGAAGEEERERSQLPGKLNREETAEEADQRERTHSGHPAAGLFLAHPPPALGADQQADGKREREAGRNSPAAN